MNTTPETKWNKQHRELFQRHKDGLQMVYTAFPTMSEGMKQVFDAVGMLINQLETETRTLLSSRDTYWKERVRNLYFILYGLSRNCFDEGRVRKEGYRNGVGYDCICKGGRTKQSPRHTIR